eukprot:scaffold9485_cov107-Cylindrotheca_fusiformis.AAC.3
MPPSLSAGPSSDLEANKQDKTFAEDEPPTFELELLLDQCKFYPAKPLAVLAGTVQSAEDSSLLSSGERCLVDIRTDVPSLIERWASDSRKKKCTGWVKLAVPLTVKIRIIVTETIEKSRNLGASLLEGTKIIQICDPPTYELKFLLNQCKFYPTKLAVLDGTVVEADSSFHEKSNLLNEGDQCWVHLRTQVISFMKRVQAAAETADEITGRDNNATGWIKFAESIPVTCNIMVTPGVTERNRKGALMLECQEVMDLQVPKGGKLSVLRISERSFQSKKDLPTLAPRTERHRVFAKWLVDKYGIDMLSTGSGVLDVAGGKGELSNALYALGVRKTIILDPDPRCGANVPYHVIKEPLDGDGSSLTERTDDVGELIRSCSIIAGMHPDQATEAIVDTSLRLGVPFAILPCCVMPKLFPNRIQKRHGDPVRSYSTFCQYLLDKAPYGIKFRVEHLFFQGRNKVIYVEECNSYCQTIEKKARIDT